MRFQKNCESTYIIVNRGATREIGIRSPATRPGAEIKSEGGGTASIGQVAQHPDVWWRIYASNRAKRLEACNPPHWV